MNEVWDLFALVGRWIDVRLGNEFTRDHVDYVALGVLWSMLGAGSTMFPLSVVWLEDPPPRFVRAINGAVDWLLHPVLPDRYRDRGFLGLCWTMWLCGLIGVDFVYMTTRSYTLRMFLVWMLSLALPVVLGSFYDAIVDRLRPPARWATDLIKGWDHAFRHRLAPGLARSMRRGVGDAIYRVRSAIDTTVQQRRVERESARLAAGWRRRVLAGDDPAPPSPPVQDLELRVGEDHSLTLSDEPDWSLFDRIAVVLREHFAGEWLAQLDAVEQRYWDLRVGPAVVTLHFDQDLGISVFPAQTAEDPEAARTLVSKIADLLGGHA